MVVTQNLNDTFHQTTNSASYDGVVRIVADGYYGTGALLYSGYAVLTAAHVLCDDDGQKVDSTTITIETLSGTTNIDSDNFLIHPDYDSSDGNNDLAIVFLTQSVDFHADRYQIYRNTDEVGAQTTLVGYGASGLGITGYDPESIPTRYKALNTIDATAGEFVDALGRTVGWNPDPERLILADFDSGYAVNDTIGRITGETQLGTGLYEGIIAPGDSGGPAFIDGQIAGVANYIVRMEEEYDSADVNDQLDSSFGEVGFWYRASTQQQWIDQSIRANYVNAPQAAPEVEKTVIEGDSGTTLLYFMVQFHGERNAVDQILSIDYATRDGSATSGEDYLSVCGTLNLYPDETQALIPVEVIGDRVIEDDETFYLDIFNPQGGSFAGDVTTLTAMRTIVDDDGWG